MVSGNGNVSHCNDRFCEIWSIPGELMASKDDHALIDYVSSQLTEPDRFTAKIEKLYQTSGTSEDLLQFKDGRLIERHSYPLAMAEREKGRVWFFRDVTDKIRLEEMMVQNEKMLSVGGLAAGMAHEINNPLAGMMQTAEVMAERLGRKLFTPANRRAAEAAGTTLEAVERFMRARNIPRMLSTINASGRRVASIVKNMLSFARKSDGVFSSCNLDDLLDSALELAATDYDMKKQYDFKRIEVVRQYAASLPAVPCEETQIQQVLLNIFSNGAHAMQEAGTHNPRFTVRTRFDEERRMACIEIEDNGPGMEEATRRRVFEPFFTTKPVGVGTGLGLSVSYFIITENHHGEMTVESRAGSGTKFMIHLPIKNETIECVDKTG